MFPNMYIFGRELPIYGTLAVIGIIISVAFAYTQRKRHGVSGEDLLHLAIFCLIGALVGAKLLFLIVSIPLVIRNLANIAANPAMLLDLFISGYVFYGGLLGAFFAFRFYFKRFTKLKIQIPESAKLVVIVGSNGS